MTPSDIPNEVLAARLDVLADAVTEGLPKVVREFTMSIPANFTRDADLVLSEAAHRLREFDKQQSSTKDETRKTNAYL